MKKIIAVVLCLTIVFAFTACVSRPVQTVEATTISEKSNRVSTKSVADIYMDIVSLVKSDDFLEVDSARITELYDIEAGLVAETYIATFTIPDAAFPGQIVLVEAVDEASAEKIKDKLDVKLADIKSQAESYDPVSSKLADECEVLCSGKNVAFFFTDKYSDMEKAFFS